MLRIVRAIRYVTPLREGGSLPALMEADDDGIYVVKFRGAGQGPKALVAELIAGEIGRLLGLRVPEIVLVELDASFARAEMDPEIQDLLRASVGLDLGLDYLPGSITYDPLVPPRPEADFAADVVWFDALVTNVDRTVRNTNLLTWHGNVWLIDHGAALYFHHDWDDDVVARADVPFPLVREHVLLPFAGEIAVADGRARERLPADRLEAVLAAVPDAWLQERYGEGKPEEVRRTYLDYLLTRLEAADAFVEEADRARAQLV